ncbi:MAG: sugar phosphate isomerase/epimerase family protein [Planctomycetota bacterium]
MPTSDAARFPLGVSLHTLDHEQQLDTLRLLEGSSVRSVELWEPTFRKDAGHVREARLALAHAGVEARTVHAAFDESLDISAPDPAIRSAGILAAGVALDLAVRMGARMIVVHSSSEPIGSAVRAARMKYAQHSLAAIAERVREAGCRVAVELLPRTCLGRSAAELLELLEGVDAATAGFCLDTNHLMDRFDSLPDVVRSLAPRLFTLHCSDYDGVDEKHWPPLRGVINWAAFLAALSAAGYSGPFHYEADLDGRTPAERLAFLERSFSQLMETSLRRGG